MRSHYKEAMEHLNPSPDALGNILNRADKLKAWRSPRRIAGMAAALCAAVALLSTGAASAYGYFFHDIPSDVAGSLQPVQLDCTSQDITMTVQDASMVDGTLAVYLTLEDVSGLDRLAEGVDFHHSYRVDKPDGTYETFYQYQSLGYDEESGTYGFLVTITPTNEHKAPVFVPGQAYTLSVEQLLLAQRKEEQTLWPDWSSLPQEPDCIQRDYYLLDYVDNYQRPVHLSDHEAEVLLAGNWEMPLADGFAITAAGFLDNGLHLQMRYPERNPEFDYGELVLVMPDGSMIGNVPGYSGAGNYCCVGFYDEYRYYYKEYIFDVSPEELEGVSLRGGFTFGGYLLDGDWEVSFRLEPEQQEPSEQTDTLEQQQPLAQQQSLEQTDTPEQQQPLEQADTPEQQQPLEQTDTPEQ